MSLSAGVPKRRLERLEGGFGVFACRVRGAKKAFGRFGGFGRLERQEKGIAVVLVSWPAGLGVPKRHLEGLEGLEGLRPGKRHA